MNAIIHVFEWAAGRCLAVAVGLRSFRGSVDDAHYLAHAAVAQVALDEKRCDGDCCVDDIVDALDRKRRRAN